MFILRFLVSALVCLVALLLPYRLRLLWFRAVSELVHLPFKIFGFIAAYLLKQLEIENPYDRH